MKSILFIVFALMTLVACVPPPAGTDPHGGTAAGGGDPVDSTENGAESHGTGGTVSVMNREGKGPLIDLKYRFAKGDSWKYTSTEETAISLSMGGAGTMGMGGMGMGMTGGASLSYKFKSVTSFTITIASVNGDGTASFTLGVDSFAVYSLPANTLLASSKGLSLSGVSVSGTISPKGVVQFTEDLYVVETKAGGRLLVRGTVSENSTSASASDGDTKVRVYARFDPKTGTLSGGAAVTKNSAEEITVSESDRRMDIIPKRFMDLFRLPAGAMNAGAMTTLKAPMMQLALSMESYSASVATLKSTISALTDKSQLPEGASMPSMTGDATVRFNQSKGRLLSMKGTIKTSMNAGVKMSIASKLTLALR